MTKKEMIKKKSKGKSKENIKDAIVSSAAKHMSKC
jgi:hypothetical protein